MSGINRSSSVARAISESRDAGTEYSTPYLLASSQLRPQNAKVRANVVELLKVEFGLHDFDAQTVARSAADLSQLKDAVRNSRLRRYGRLEVQFIEFDVVTWRILPSLENIRFEGDRALESSALRYDSLSGSPVLTLRHNSREDVVSGLREQTNTIWRTNPHAKSIPLRGIETPGLLAISRLSIGDSPVIGMLDATDGFSRTVGAHRGSGIDLTEVLFELPEELADMRLRNELIELRDTDAGLAETSDGEVAAARLRTSVMPRAQVIVGYRWLGETDDGVQGFDYARRALVGHIHLEPAMKFTDSTQFALKAKIALDAVYAAGELPTIDGFAADEVLESLTRGEAGADLGAPALHFDEISLLAVDTLRSSLAPSRLRVVNRAISSLTGKAPSKTDRGVLAVDTAMRAKLIATGTGSVDAAYIGRRSTLGRAWMAAALSPAKLSRRPILELLDEAVEAVVAHRLTVDGNSPSKAAAELAALALFDLVEAPGGPLLIRSGSRDEKGDYLPEPPQIIDRLMRTEQGLNQLAQAILDVRAGRKPRLLAPEQPAADTVMEDNDLLSRADIVGLATGKVWKDDLGSATDPVKQLDQSLERIIALINDLDSLVRVAGSLAGPDGVAFVSIDGAPLDEQWKSLSGLSFTLHGWAQTHDLRASAAKASQAPEDDAQEDDLYEDIDIEINDEAVN